MSRVPDGRQHDPDTRTPRRRRPRGSRLHVDRRRPRTCAAPRLPTRPLQPPAPAPRAGHGSTGRAGGARERVPGLRRHRGCLPVRELSARPDCSAAHLATGGRSGLAAGLPGRPEPGGDLRRRRDARHAGRPGDAGDRPPRRPRLPVQIGDWPTGLYFAQLTSPGRVGFAPFVVAPRRLGENRAAVVLPTRTWQAYNARDDDGNGVGDTWYSVPGLDQVRLGRPFENRGVPPHFRKYDLGFLHWLQDTGRGVDVLAQEDLDETTGAQLAAAYDLLVFPGHHEYVTEAEYDAVTGFRDAGGNLMFLSANNFFWRVDVRDGVMTRVAKWRTLGRPEAALLGVQYIASDKARSRAPWHVRPTAPRLDVRGRRARPRPRVLPGGHRDRRRRTKLASRDPGRRRDPEPARPGQVGAHDLLRDAARRESVLRRRVHPRGLHPAAGDPDAADESLGAVGADGGVAERAPPDDARAEPPAGASQRAPRPRAPAAAVSRPRAREPDGARRVSAPAGGDGAGGAGLARSTAAAHATASTSGGRSGSPERTG